LISVACAWVVDIQPPPPPAIRKPSEANPFNGFPKYSTQCSKEIRSLRRKREFVSHFFLFAGQKLQKFIIILYTVQFLFSAKFKKLSFKLLRKKDPQVQNSPPPPPSFLIKI
jgi:hypothetical protein